MTLWYGYWLKAGKQWIRKAAKLEIAIQLIHLFWSLIFEKNNIRYREAIIVNGDVNLNIVLVINSILYFSPIKTIMEAIKDIVKKRIRSISFLKEVYKKGYSLAYRAIKYRLMNEIGEHPSFHPLSWGLIQP